MSGYWDAIDRETRAQPGTAQPRPRSRFEFDAIEADGEPESLATFVEMDAEGPAPELRAERTSRSSDRSYEPPHGSPGVPAAAETLPPEQPAASAAPAPALAERLDVPAAQPVPALDAIPPAAPRDNPILPALPLTERATGDAPPPAETFPSPATPASVRAAEREFLALARSETEIVSLAAPSVVPAEGVAPEAVPAQPIALAGADVADALIDPPMQTPQEPALTIEIGEIHIRIAPEPDLAASRATLRPARSAAGTSLETFLRRTGEVRQ